MDLDSRHLQVCSSSSNYLCLYSRKRPLEEISPFSMYARTSVCSSKEQDILIPCVHTTRDVCTHACSHQFWPVRWWSWTWAFIFLTIFFFTFFSVYQTANRRDMTGNKERTRCRTTCNKGPRPDANLEHCSS